MTLAFINQAGPCIKRKLQKLECLGGKSLRDLVTVPEKVYNGSGSAEERRRGKKGTKFSIWLAFYWLQPRIPKTIERNCDSWWPGNRKKNQEGIKGHDWKRNDAHTIRRNETQLINSQGQKLEFNLEI